MMCALLRMMVVIFRWYESHTLDVMSYCSGHALSSRLDFFSMESFHAGAFTVEAGFWWRLRRSGKTTEWRKEERSAFRAGSGCRIWFSIFQISGASSTTAARDSVGHLLHHRSTLVCNCVKNGGVVQSFGGKGIVLRFSDSAHRKVLRFRRCQSMMCALLGMMVVIFRWYESHTLDVMSYCSGHALSSKLDFFSMESFRLSGYRSENLILLKLKLVTRFTFRC
ncbi:hypothetical protein Bca4012_036444 [Brassica carinata]